MNSIETANEVAKAQTDIEYRLNRLERLLGLPVLAVRLEQADVTRMSDAVPVRLRMVRIEVSPALGQIGVMP